MHPSIKIMIIHLRMCLHMYDLYYMYMQVRVHTHECTVCVCPIVYEYGFLSLASTLLDCSMRGNDRPDYSCGWMAGASYDGVCMHVSPLILQMKPHWLFVIIRNTLPPWCPEQHTHTQTLFPCLCFICRLMLFSPAADAARHPL